MQIELGTQVERYTIEAMIGEGGQGRVFRVRHMQLGTEHALKLMLNATPGVRERLLREGQAQARLRHPNIVNVTDVIDVRGLPGLVMEFVRGPSLADLLAQRELTVEQVDLLARGVLDAMVHAHGHRFIHRDLKPDNVMCAVTPRGLVPKVMDFGLVKALGDDSLGVKQTRSGVMMGSAHYMSPEQIRSTKRVDERTDVWALGVILYELLTRRVPFDGEDLFEIFAAATSGKYQPVEQLRTDVPARMRRAIEAALVIDTEQRVQNVQTLGALWRGDIESIAESGRAMRSAWDDELLQAYTGGHSIPPPAPSGEFETWADGTMDDSEEPVPGPTLAEPVTEDVPQPPARREARPTGTTIEAPVAALPTPERAASAETLADEPPVRAAPTAPTSSSPRRSSAPLLVAAALLLGVGGIAIGAVAVATLGGATPGSQVADEEPRPEALAAAKPEAGEPDAGGPAEPVREPVEEAVADDVVGEAAVQPVPARPAPVPEAIPAPGPRVVAPPQPPPPKPAAPGLGTLTITASLSDGEYFYLSSGPGVSVASGDELPAGVYQIYFSSGAQVKDTTVKVAEGDSATLRCSPDPVNPKCKVAVESF